MPTTAETESANPQPTRKELADAFKTISRIIEKIEDNEEDCLEIPLADIPWIIQLIIEYYGRKMLTYKLNKNGRALKNHTWFYGT
jgi:hypothetical protein